MPAGAIDGSWCPAYQNRHYRFLRHHKASPDHLYRKQAVYISVNLTEIYTACISLHNTMAYRYFLLLPIFNCTLIHLAMGQKHDYQWPLGSYNPLGCNSCLYRFFYNFKTDPPSIVLRSDTISTQDFAAGYSNSNGDIRFFSSGLRIFDAQSRLIENGSGLNPGYPPSQSYYSFPVFQSGFFIEHPGDSGLLHLFHLDFNIYPPNTFNFVGREFRMTTMDTRANGGAGAVVDKNIVLLEGQLQTAAATRHANGRDWWIMISDAYENRHYRFLLTPDGISGPMVQEIGSRPPIPDKINRWTVGSKFSTNGRYYLDLTPEWGFSLFEFDRCTGLLSNEQRVNYLQDRLRAIAGGGGVEFSPDERFLYLTASHRYTHHVAFPAAEIGYMIQYDLQESGWSERGDTLNEVEPGPYGSGVGLKYIDKPLLGTATGPDGRIYITYLGGSYCTVQYPDRKGKAAIFKYDSPDFKNNIYRGIPYLPNYRLGPSDGSPCDTLGLNNVPVANFRMDTPDSSDLQTRYFYNLAHHEPATWLWDFGDGSPVSTDTSALHTYAKPGKYRVCLTVTNRYGRDTYCRDVYVGVVAGEEAQETTEGPQLLPNPADEATVLYLPEAPGGPLRFVVTNAPGRVVLHGPVSGQWTEIETAAWPAGLYFVRLEQGGRQVWAGKLMVR